MLHHKRGNIPKDIQRCAIQLVMIDVILNKKLMQCRSSLEQYFVCYTTIYYSVHELNQIMQTSFVV